MSQVELGGFMNFMTWTQPNPLLKKIYNPTQPNPPTLKNLPNPTVGLDQVDFGEFAAHPSMK